MSRRILGISTVFAVLLASSGIATSYDTATSSYRTTAHEHRQLGSRLPKELKMMWRNEEHARLKAMPKEQRRGWLKAQWASMSDQQRQVKMAELQKKWDSQPESVRQRLLERKHERREARKMHREQGGTESSGSARSMQQ
jgi:hypothetical protein